MRRVQKILEIILSEFLAAENLDVTEKKIISILVDHGYKEEEINKALQIIFDTLKNDNQKSIKKKRPVRVLTNMEKYKIEQEAQFFLLNYYNSGCITLFQLEEVFNRIISMNGVIDKKIVSNLIDKVTGLSPNNTYYKSVIN